MIARRVLGAKFLIHATTPWIARLMPGVAPMDTIRLLLTLLDIVDVTATAVSLAAFGETWHRLGRVGDDQTASNMADIEQFIDLTYRYARRY